MQVGLTNEKFLRREFAVPSVFEIMEPYLNFLEVLPKVETNSRSVRYKQETTSASSDTLKKTPATMTAGAQFPFVDISSISIKSAILNEQGFAVRIDRDAIRFQEGIDSIQRAFKRVGYWLAQSVNSNIGSILTAGVTQGSTDWTPTAVWSAATATPVNDLIEFESLLSNQEGYPYMMTDVYLHYTNFKELKAYLTSIDIGDLKQQQIFGMPMNNEIRIPVVGATVHRLLSGISEGTILGLDLRNPAGTVYYNTDPKYSTPTITYRQSDGTQKTVQNFGLNYYQYEENDTHSTVMQFWYDNVAVIQESKSGLYDNGI